MKKISYTGALVLLSIGLFSCESTNTAEQQKGVVVDRDSVATEYEVTETVVEYDTTERTRTVEATKENDN